VIGLVMRRILLLLVGSKNREAPSYKESAYLIWQASEPVQSTWSEELLARKNNGDKAAKIMFEKPQGRREL
jgi:hypothetical protein